MSNADARGWHIALTADALLNRRTESPPLPDVLSILDSHGYGILQLPPSEGIGDPGLLLAVIADQVAEYAHHGYAIAAIGLDGEPGDGLHWRRLSSLLRHRSVELPPRHILSPSGDLSSVERRLSAFLSGYDIPEEQQRIWRT